MKMLLPQEQKLLSKLKTKHMEAEAIRVKTMRVIFGILAPTILGHNINRKANTQNVTQQRTELKKCTQTVPCLKMKKLSHP